MGLGIKPRSYECKCSALSITWMIIKKKKKTDIIQINLPSTFEAHDFSFWIRALGGVSFPSFGNKRAQLSLFSSTL